MDFEWVPWRLEIIIYFVCNGFICPKLIYFPIEKWKFFDDTLQIMEMHIEIQALELSQWQFDWFFWFNWIVKILTTAIKIRNSLLYTLRDFTKCA